MMRLYFVFTSLFRICFLAVMLCFSSSAFAAITLRLEDGVSLQFSSGDFDIQRYTGEMRDVVLFQDDQMVAEADFVKMQTSGEFETASFVIDDLVVENLQLYPTDGSELIVKSITAQDLPLGLIAGAPGTADDLAGMNWDQAFFKIDEMLYLDAPAGFGAEIASIGLRDIGILQLAAGTSLLEKIRLEMPMMRIVPLGRSPAATEFETWLSRLGRDDLIIQLNTQTNMREQADILRQITGFELALSGLGEIYFDIEIGVPTPLYEAAMMQVATGEAEEEMLGMLFSAATLHGARLDIADGGALALIDQSPEMPERSALAQEAGFLLTSFLPQYGPELAATLGQFIEQGGSLQLTIVPQMAMPFEAMLGFLFLPDLAIEQLGISLTHQP